MALLLIPVALVAALSGPGRAGAIRRPIQRRAARTGPTRRRRCDAVTPPSSCRWPGWPAPRSSWWWAPCWSSAPWPCCWRTWERVRPTGSCWPVLSRRRRRLGGAGPRPGSERGPDPAGGGLPLRHGELHDRHAGPRGGPVGVLAGWLTVGVLAVFVAAVVVPPSRAQPVGPAGPGRGPGSGRGRVVSAASAGPGRLPALRRLDSLVLAGPAWVVAVGLLLHR